jgi:hypothetical protein
VRCTTIEDMCDFLFAREWALLDRKALRSQQLGAPGVYLLAYPEASLDNELAGQRVRIEQVIYVGMSLSQQGLAGRLGQFLDAIERGVGHSAGNAFFQHNGGIPHSALEKTVPFYFATFDLPCCTRKTDAGPDDFRKMGLIAGLELYAIARIKEQNGRVPGLNRSVGGVLDEVHEMANNH